MVVEQIQQHEAAVVVSTIPPTIQATLPVWATMFSVWPFTVAFIAASVALLYSTQEFSLKIAAKNITGSTLIAGGASQLVGKPVINVIANVHPFLKPLEQTGEYAAVGLLAIAGGLLCHLVMPIINEWFEHYRKSKFPKPPTTGATPNGDSA